MEADFRVLAGPSMSGKTYSVCKSVLEQAYANPSKNYIIIIPDQAGNAYEKKLIQMNREMYGRPGFMNIDVLGFNRFSFKVFEEMGKRDTDVLEEYEKSMIIRVCLGKLENDLDIYKSSIDKTGFAGELKSLISEMIQYNILPQDIDKLLEDGESGRMSPALMMKLKDIKKIYESFLQVLSARGSGLSEERLKILARILDGSQPCKVTDGVTFFFDEYRGYTPDQLSVIKALSKRASEISFSISIEPEIIKSGRALKEHDLFYQSYSTLRQLQELLGRKPEITFLERSDRRPKILTHLEQNFLRFPIKEMVDFADELTGKRPALNVFSVPDPETEIRLVATDIKKLIKDGFRYKDIVIATCDIESFYNMAEGIFEEYDIPLFCDFSRKLRKNPFTDAIIRALEIVDRDFDYNGVFGYVKTGVLEVSDDYGLDILENYILRTGIRGHKIWNQKMSPRGRKISEKTKENFARMENVRLEITDSLKPFEGLGSGSHTVKEYTSAIKEFMSQMDYEASIEKTSQKLGEREMFTDARAMNSLYSVLTRLLDETEDFLGDTEMDIHDFSEILQSGINEISIGVIPPMIDSVTAIDPMRSRVLDTRVLFFININDGIVPPPTSSGGLISDKDKALLDSIFEEKKMGKHLADHGTAKSVSELFMLYQLMSKPSDMLCLSYSLADVSGGAVEPSYMVGRVLRLFPGLKVRFRNSEPLSGTIESDKLDFIYCVRDMLEIVHDKGDFGKNQKDYQDKLNIAAGYKCYGEKFSENILEGFDFGNPAGDISQKTMKNLNLKLSVSKIERYMKCPYSYFLRYILGLSERDEKRIESYDVGNLMHECLEKTMNFMKDKKRNDWKNTSDEELKNIATGFLEEAWSSYCEENYSDETDGRTEMVFSNLRNLAGKTIRILKEHIVSGEMLPEQMEQTFRAEFLAERPDGEKVPICIEGKIDRLDMKEEGERAFIRIIDYKTGSTNFSPQKIEYGTDIQLTVYAGIVYNILSREMAAKNVIPAGLYYYHVNDPVVDMVGEKTLAKYGGDLETALYNEVLKAQKLSGVSNDDPKKNGDSQEDADLRGTEDYTHRFLNLHDINLVSPESGNVIDESKVIPVSVNSQGEYKTNAVVSGTEGMTDMCDYSMKLLKDGAELILSGSFEKKPVKFATEQMGICSYCSYSSVCRFNKTSGSPRKVPKAVGTVSKQMEALKVNPEDKVEIKNSRFT